MDEVDVIVIGAGVVGLAIGRALALQGLETVVLERGDRIGGETSSRSSEVIHAGLYYPTGSLKASLCTRGREELYAYCAAQGVPHLRCGKLLVAVREEERAALRDIAARALANGVTNLRHLSSEQVRQMEPALRVAAGLWSPSTGIVDSHALMLSYQGDLERAGGVVVLRSPVVGVHCGSAQHVVTVGGVDGMELAATRVVNAAGLWAQSVAARCTGLHPSFIPELFFAKGNYFSLMGRAPFLRLVYPMPQPGGLGIHMTLDMAGSARFGPDVEWLEAVSPDALDYAVNPLRLAEFVDAIRRYWPQLPPGALQPAYAGVRPKLSGPSQPAADFMLQGPREHGVPGLLNLFGIESPGLTSSLAIAGECVRLLAL